MEYRSLLSFALLSGIVGFAAYCASCSMHVWKTRNGSSGHEAPRKWGRRGAILLAFAGLALMIGGIAWRAAVQHEGRLRGDGLFVPRKMEGLTVAWIAGEGPVQAGEILARFSDPQREGEIQSLKLKAGVLASEKQALLNEPLTEDTRTTRQEQEIAMERRHLQARQDQLGPARDLVKRERLRDAEMKREQIAKWAAELDKLGRELEQASVRQELAEREFAQVDSMFQKQVASAEEHAQKQAAAKVAQVEQRKLREQIAHAQRQKAQAEKDLEDVDREGGGQIHAIDSDMARIDRELISVDAAGEPLKERLASDEARAKALRSARLEKVEWELKQAEAQRAGLEGMLKLSAPFSGRVVWRNPAPQGAERQEALCVLAPAGAFEMHVRLSDTEAKALRNAGAVKLELKEGLEKKFSGRFARAKDLPDDPGHVLVALTCEPPADAVGELVKAKPVKEPVLVKLNWSPPVYTLPPVRVGAALAAGGLALWAGGGIRRKRRVNGEARRPPQAEDQDALLAQFGSAGPMLRMLGSRLREAIRSQRVDPELLSAIEWNLDRHHVRAIALIGAGLGDDEGLEAELEALRERGGDGVAGEEQMQRLVGILRVLAWERIDGARQRAGGNGESHLRRDNGEAARLWSGTQHR